MSKKILLTGGTGFVGTKVLSSLINMGFSIRLVIRAEKIQKFDSKKGIESIFITQDLFKEDSKWFCDVCKDIDTVIHVAWYAEPGEYLNSAKNIDCLIGTLQLAKGAAMAGVKKFIGIGTCLEYDLTSGFLSIDTPLKPLTPYAGAKAAAFNALSNWLPINGVKFNWCRLFYLYGDGEDNRRLVAYIRSRLEIGKTAELSSGTKIRDYLEITEAGNLIANVVENNIQGAINICSGIPITLRELAEKIADEYNRRDLLKFEKIKESMTYVQCIN